MSAALLQALVVVKDLDCLKPLLELVPRVRTQPVLVVGRYVPD